MWVFNNTDSQVDLILPNQKTESVSPKSISGPIRVTADFIKSKMKSFKPNELIFKCENTVERGMFNLIPKAGEYVVPNDVDWNKESLIAHYAPEVEASTQVVDTPVVDETKKEETTNPAPQTNTDAPKVEKPNFEMADADFEKLATELGNPEDKTVTHPLLSAAVTKVLPDWDDPKYARDVEIALLSRGWTINP